MDPRGCDQVPGPGAAPLRAWTRPRPPRCWRTWPTGRCGRSSSRWSAWRRRSRCEVPAQLAARRRAQRLPAARRHPVRHARAAGHGRAHGRAGPRGRRAAPGPRAGRARARRGPRRSSSDALAAAHARATRGAQRTRTGLREDQAAAALAVLTDGRRVSVINAPAGSGKTRVLAEAARAWAAAGLGPVIGITASQSARNTLAAGVPDVLQQRPVPGPPARPAAAPAARSRSARARCCVIDEASMLPGPDLADLISYAEARGAKVILAGDTSQLQAVENGGGMSLLADRARLRPAGRAGPVPRRLGTDRQPAAARRRHQRAG